MKSYKFLLLIFIVSVSFTQKKMVDINTIENITTPDQIKAANVNTPEHLKSWEADDTNVKNPELKKALEQLRKEFQEKRNDVQKKYKAKVEPLKQERDSNIDLLKKDYTVKRNSLKEKYGMNNADKPKKLKAAKKNEKGSKKKPSKVNYMTKPPVKKVSPSPSKVDKKSDPEKIDSKDKK